MFSSVAFWNRISSLIGTLSFFVLAVGDALAFTNLFESIRPTKDAIPMMIWNLLPVAFMQIFLSVCPVGVSGLSTSMMQKCSLNLFAANRELFHHQKSLVSPFLYLFQSPHEGPSLQIPPSFSSTSYSNIPLRALSCTGPNFVLPLDRAFSDPLLLSYDPNLCQ